MQLNTESHFYLRQYKQMLLPLQIYLQQVSCPNQPEDQYKLIVQVVDKSCTTGIFWHCVLIMLNQSQMLIQHDGKRDHYNWLYSLNESEHTQRSRNIQAKAKLRAHIHTRPFKEVRLQSVTLYLHLIMEYQLISMIHRDTQRNSWISFYECCIHIVSCRYGKLLLSYRCRVYELLGCPIQS